MIMKQISSETCVLDPISTSLLFECSNQVVPLLTTIVNQSLSTAPSRGGGVAVYVLDVNQPSLPTPFHSVLVSISVSMALLTVFHSINSPDNSPLSHSVPPVLFLPYWSFQLYISLYESIPQP